MKLTKEQLAMDADEMDWLRLKDLYVDSLKPEDAEVFLELAVERQAEVIQAAMDWPSD